MNIDAGNLSKKKIIIRFLYLKINQGFFRVGDKLPSEMELSIKFGYNRHTISSAYKYLIMNGVVEFVPGKGNYLRANFVESISETKFTYFNKKITKEIGRDSLPLNILNKYTSLNNIIYKSELFYNDKKVAIRFYILDLPAFLSKEGNNINVDNMLYDLSMLGIPITSAGSTLNIKKNSLWEIKDKYIISNRISLYDENNRRVVFIYSVYSGEKARENINILSIPAKV